MNYKGIELNMDWTPEKDVPISDLPKCAGLYAEIHWRSFGVRIGHSTNIKSRHSEAKCWMNKMHAGTAKPSEQRRSNLHCQAVKLDGAKGFGHFVISIDPRLEDGMLRLELETYLFNWVSRSDIYQDFNTQHGHRNALQFSTIEEAIDFHNCRTKT